MTRILAVAAALAAAIAFAPAALADESMYLQEVREKVTTPLTAAQAVSLGNTACAAMRAAIDRGTSFGQARHEADQAVGEAQQQMGLSMSLPDGMFLVEAAEHQLC